jgi:type III secretion protein T
MGSVDFSLLIDALTPVYTAIMALSLGMARALGLIMVTPAFTRLGLTGIIRSAVAFAIALPLWHKAYGVASSASAFDLVGMLGKETILGMLAGLALGVPFWAAEVAGELADLQRGSTMAQLLDPLGGTQSSVMASLLTITLVALFFASGGFMAMLDLFYRSFRWWPMGTWLPTLQPGFLAEVLGILDRTMQAAIKMIAPVIIMVLGADVLMAYLARVSPQLHVFDLSLAVKNLVFVVFLVLYAAFLLPGMFDLLGTLRDALGGFDPSHLPPK